MARDTDKNAYYYVGIPRNSDTYKKLLQDAKDKGLTIPKMIASRLDDFYKGIHAGAEQIAVPVAQPLEKEETSEGQGRLNALAALDEWS